MEPIPIITASVPFDFVASSDPDQSCRQLADFMERAQKAIIHAGIPLIDEETLEGVNEILRCFDLENANYDEIGYVVPIKDRDCAQRLLDAGVLDQTAGDIVDRWGVVGPSVP